ncbi:hypothetical protein [Myroides odoratimimus]|uniref:hypothetical protein n=1 Tax=Myroides odoratimimus TaxID=76832 RepID=UPI00055AF806|nr:hypothetical protein [Myroides odoratimimus]SHL25225.1 hypothetical protein SAMN05444275_10393 [Myroides odoratimimus subsp. xuanwuensis]
MEKELYIKHLTDNINNNFDKYQSYLDSRDLYSFCSLKTLINENIHCLLLNNHIASICVTNHILERFVKLSIIEHGTAGLNYSNDELYNTALLESYNFDDKVLSKTLLQLKNIGLITDIEYNHLDNFRDNYRNPYSHSDTKNIIQDPSTIKGRMYSIEDFKNITNKIELENIQYEEKTISTFSPAMAQLSIQEHAIDNAFNYFKEVFNIMIIVDKRLQVLNSNK